MHCSTKPRLVSNGIGLSSRLRSMKFLSLENMPDGGLSHYEAVIDSVPKTWPRTVEGFTQWVNETSNQPPNSPTLRHAIVVPGTSSCGRLSSEYEVAGFVSTDLVTSENMHKYPGAEIGDVNISYLVFDDFRGIGIAPAAVEKLLQDFHSPECGDVILRVSVNNIPSQRVAQKCGFEPTVAVDVPAQPGFEPDTLVVFRPSVSLVG